MKAAPILQPVSQRFPSILTAQIILEGMAIRTPHSIRFGLYRESDGLSNNESVELSIQDESALSGDSIYLEKAYIRSENGQSYVDKADDSNRLVKQYVKTGATAYSTSTEILEGLTMEDRIAFPYGKNVKEGARVINHREEDSEDSQDEDDEADPDGDMGINMDGAVPMGMEE